MRAKYGWAPDAAWLEARALGSIRLAQGCSASLVSPDGLVMTNHHCARECLSELADAKHDYIANGFYAATAADEKKCPALEANQLTEITDVTKQMEAATAGKSDRAFHEAERAAKAADRKRVRHGGGRALPGGDAVSGRRLRSVQVQAVPGCARGVRAGGNRRVLRRRSRQFHLSRATIWTPPSCASTIRASRCTPIPILKFATKGVKAGRHRLHQRQSRRHRARRYAGATRISARCGISSRSC
jgi:hypothetical protein